MKKLVALLLTTVMTISLVACGAPKTEETAPVETEEVETVEETVEAEEAETVEETAEVEGVTTEETTVTVPTFQCDWDKVVCTFGEDGSFKMELPEYQITEEGTWEIADGIITVTSPAGKTYSSVIEDGVCKLNYVADASEQLVAQLYTSDYAFLDGVATDAAVAVPEFTCDWDKVVCTFGEDGSFKMELPEYQIAEEGTWTANEDGTYTITSPAGKTYTSYTGEDGIVHLDYVADASEQLVAQLYIK